MLVEQIVMAGPKDDLEEKSLAQAESLLTNVISPDHRMMIVNNVGKGGGLPRTLRYVMRLRLEKNGDQNQTLINEVIPDAQ